MRLDVGPLPFFLGIASLVAAVLVARKLKGWRRGLFQAGYIFAVMLAFGWLLTVSFEVMAESDPFREAVRYFAEIGAAQEAFLAKSGRYAGEADAHGVGALGLLRAKGLSWYKQGPIAVIEGSAPGWRARLIRNDIRRAWISARYGAYVLEYDSKARALRCVGGTDPPACERDLPRFLGDDGKEELAKIGSGKP
jgi:hypothetical protein